MKKVAVVTGGSNGIGQCTAELLSAAGYTVYELSRSGRDSGAVRHITADVSDQEAVRAAFALVYEKEGRLDLLVNNAAFGISGSIEFTELAAAERLFAVNFFGMVRCTQAALPYLRQSRGRIINVDTVMGVIPIPFQAFHSAAKAAEYSLTLSLANEVRPLGVSVCTVLPGDVRTGFTAAREKSLAGTEIYGGVIAKAVGAMEKDEINGMPPEAVARRIVRLARKRRVKLATVVGGKYRLFLALWKLLPVGFGNWLVGKIYG